MTPESWLLIVLGAAIMYMLGWLTLHIIHNHKRNKRIAEMAKAQAERRRQYENQKSRRTSA